MFLEHEGKTPLAGEIFAKTGARKGAPGAGQTATAAGRNVVIVHESAVTCALVAAILGQRGHAVHAAADAFQGLAAVRQRPVDVLITLDEMQVCGGRELARRVWQLWPHMPILFLGSGVGPGAGPDVLQGSCAWLRTPFSSEELLDAVDRVLSRTSAAVQSAVARGWGQAHVGRP